MIDSHCHLDLPRFEAHCARALDRARGLGVRGFVVTGIDPSGWTRQQALSIEQPDVYFTLGLHPWYVGALQDVGEVDKAVESLEAALYRMRCEKLVGLGEIGLDRAVSRDASLVARQVRAMRAQLEMAQRLDHPVILHIVRAHGLALEILKTTGVPDAGGVIHSFTGSAEMAREYQALGLFISFSTGILRNATSRWIAAANAVAPERLLVETDSPDQSPFVDHPLNEPANLTVVIDALAAARGEAPAELGARTAANAERLFRF